MVIYLSVSLPLCLFLSSHIKLTHFSSSPFLFLLLFPSIPLCSSLLPLISLFSDFFLFSISICSFFLLLLLSFSLSIPSSSHFLCFFYSFYFYSPFLPPLFLLSHGFSLFLHFPFLSLMHYFPSSSSSCLFSSLYLIIKLMTE